MSTSAHYVPNSHEDRQWDCRFNVPTKEYLDTIVSSIKSECDKGKFKYILISGVEIGTRPSNNDYMCEHIHVAVIFNNRASKSSILRNWQIIEGHGYYLVPRDRNLPYSGWRSHHIKSFSKVNQTSLCLFEHGDLPVDRTAKVPQASEEEKKRKLDDILMDMRDMLGRGEDEQCFTKYPRNYLVYGPRVKAMITQKSDFFKTNADPNIWLYGFPGTGKTSILLYVYPNLYKKNLYNKFFDLYDPKVHTHMMLEDLDHEAIERLSINFVKTICDKQGFAIDKKYQTPQLASTTVLVSSNFQIQDLVQDGKGVEENKAALLRRFYHVRIDNFLRLLELKLLPKWDQKKLLAEGNADMGKLFISWDYVADQPMCTPIASPEVYQKKIRDHFYK